jgi:hypothetical protein
LATVAKLKQEPGGNVGVYGRSTLMRTLLQHNLRHAHLRPVASIGLGDFAGDEEPYRLLPMNFATLFEA